MAKTKNEPEILEQEPETEVQNKASEKDTARKDAPKSETLRKFSKFKKGE